VLAPVVELCILLGAWLNLIVGVSRRHSSTFLKALGFILLAVLNLIFGVLQSAGFQTAAPTLRIPRDVRTVYQHGLEPDITRTPCCPKCYKTYSLDELPETCTWKKSKKANPCGAELWQQRRTRKGKIKNIPQSLYATQSFASWLHFFLGRAEIEDHLEQSYQKNLQRQNAALGGPMNDIQDSPAWRSLGNFLLTPYNLVWSLYIDWFNPYTNKIAGMYPTYPQFLSINMSILRQNSVMWCNCSILPESAP
jgi:hypothetical protein